MLRFSCAAPEGQTVVWNPRSLWVLFGLALALAIIPPAAADRQWSTPQVVEWQNAGGSTEPVAVIDEGGNVTVVWREAIPGDYGNSVALYGNRYAEAAGWGEPVELDLSFLCCPEPALAAGPDGTAVAAWFNWSGPDPILIASRFVPASGWGAREVLASPTAAFPYGIHAGFDRGGNITVAWSDSDGSGDSNVKAARYEPGAGWQAPFLVESPDVGSAYISSLAADASGTWWVVWESLLSGGQQVTFASRYTPGSGWGAPTNISPAFGPYWGGQIVLSAAGDAVFLFTESVNASNTDLWSIEYRKASGWSNFTRLGTDANRSTWGSAMAGNAAGGAVALWAYGGVGLQGDLWSSFYSQGSGWGAAEPIETAPNVSAYAYSVVLDDSGNATAFWLQDDGTWNMTIVVTRFVRGTGWSAPRALPLPGIGGAWRPSMAGNGAGGVALAWGQTEQGMSDIWVSVYREGGPSPAAPLPLSIGAPAEGATVGGASIRVAGTTAPGASLEINGRLFEANASGGFAVDLPVLPGAVRIEMTAREGGRTAWASVNVTVNDTRPPYAGKVDEVNRLRHALEAARANLSAAGVEYNASKARLDAEHAQLSATKSELGLARQAAADASALSWPLWAAVLGAAALAAFLFGRRGRGPKKGTAGR